jgi:hypothetical protein
MVQSGIGASYGTSRKAAFDRWFRYPAGLPATALLALFEPCRNPSGGLVVDPFAGAGTVGTAARLRNLPFLGVEAHPEIAELASLKVTSSLISADQLVQAAQYVATRHQSRNDNASEADLVRRCFSPDVLQTLVGMRELILRDCENSAQYLKWALLATLRDVASVRVGWPYVRPTIQRRPTYRDPVARFLTRVQWIADDIAGDTSTTSGTILVGDARSRDTWRRTRAGTATLCLTSPPYLNNFDYADATRLETYFWGRNRSWQDMVQDVRSNMLVATTQQARVGLAAADMQSVATFPALHRRVEALTNHLRAERTRRPRGKEYDRVLPSYMAGILDVLHRLRTFLAPGAMCGWVVGDSAPYGVHVDTPDLILHAAEELGYRRLEVIHLRQRGLRWRQNGSRHQTALSEKLLWFQAPS